MSKAAKHVATKYEQAKQELVARHKLAKNPELAKNKMTFHA
jgi:hypothetical protein